MMKPIWVVLSVAMLAISGCGSGDTNLTPAKEQTMRDAFHSKPDINTLSPEMRKRVEGMMAASKSGPPGTSAGAPPTKP